MTRTIGLGQELHVGRVVGGLSPAPLDQQQQAQHVARVQRRKGGLRAQARERAAVLHVARRERRMQQQLLREPQQGACVQHISTDARRR